VATGQWRESTGNCKTVPFTHRKAAPFVDDAENRLALAPARFYQWKAKYGGMEISEMRRLHLLEEENARLKKILAQQGLDIDALKVASIPTRTRRGSEE
jgi:putative transposase